MFRTKKDVDKHVRSTLSKLREDEKNLRGYRIAGLYYNIGEYSSALEYIQRYIQANDKNPAAYKVLGQCYEKLKRPDKQLLAYQRSLELDKKQTDLLVEVCKLLQNNELSDVTPAKAKYWYDLAESRNIHDSAVLNLKLKFMNGGDQTGVQDIIIKEIIRRPLDIGLRIRLVYHYLDKNRVDDAFKYVSDIEMKPIFKFRNSSDWYATVALVLDKYKEKYSATINKNWPYWLQLITTNERQLFLTLARTPKDSNAIDSNLLEATNLLAEFDQNLNTVATSCSFPDSERDLASEFLSHFRGQFSLHAASLLFKREAEQSLRGNWHETTKSTLPLLLLAFNFGAIDGNQLWLRNASETTKQLIDTWQAQSSFRVSQAARTLLSCVASSGSSDNAMLANFRKICTDKYSVWSSQEDVLNEIRSIVADSDWRKKLYRTLFVSKEHQNAISSSHLVKSKAFETPTFDWPDINSLAPLEVKSQEADPSSLGHLVYLAIGHEIPTASKTVPITIDQEFKCVLFPKLNYSTNNLMHCNAETLNQLDIDSFLYATTLQTKRNIGAESTLLLSSTPVHDENKPKILPYVNMASTLATEEQNDWWTAAFKIYHNIAGEELAELRATLQYGIEAVRGIGTPKIDLIILLKLGQIFSKKAQRTTKSVERGFFEDRSEALFKFALYMLRVQNNSRSTSEPFRRLFKYTVGNNFFEIEQEVNALAEEAITFLAGRYFNKNAYEECIEDLEGIKLPFATYFQAESYRKLTEISDTPKKNKRVYLDKARDYLKQTLDLLDGPNVDKNHPLKSIVDEDIKRLHNETRKLETTQSMSDSFVSANGRSDLEESSHRYDRDTETATPTPGIGYDNIERMVRQIMESLNILKEDVAEVRSRVQNIEERMNKDDDIDINDAEDYYFDDEAHNQSRNLNNTSMMANVSRNQTFNQQTPKASQLPNIQLNARSTPTNPAFPHQSPVGMSNSYNMNPLLNNMYGQMPVNPYQAALLNATTQNYGPLGNSFQLPPHLSYGSNDLYSLQQQLLAQLPSNDPLLGFFQQQQQQQNVIQQPLPQQSFGLPNPFVSSAITTTPPVVPKVQPSVAPSTVNVTPTSAQKQWNTPIKNTPVEKGPPVNVVITSSDPVPQNITTISTQATPSFSVTIPPQHIKNNPATQTFGAALANPTITAALTQDKKQQSPSQSNVSSKPITSTATAPSTQEQKSIFGNLTKPFSSTPFSSPGTKTTPEVKKPEPPKADATKPSPFASFSFGVQSSNTSAASNQSKPTFSFSNIGQSLNKSETSSLANAATPETPKNDTVANTSSTSANNDEDHYEPTAHFEPVIPLPDLVEVKTGEENEEILFEHRAKLLRYVKESKEWKERGIGNMKVMVNKDDPNKVRLLMRREQVLKLCCNQFLEKDTKFNKMPNTETALTWFGHDYSENELQVEMLAIRFKTADLCKQFHNAILSAQEKMTIGKAQPSNTKSTKPDEKSTTKEGTSNKAPTETKGFGDQFKPKAGSWSCKACYTSNTADSMYCACCEEPKDDTVPKKEKANVFGSSNAAAPKFSFGNFAALNTAKPVENTAVNTSAVKPAGKGFGDQFKPKPGSWSCKACYTQNTADSVYCACCEEPKDDTIPKKEKENIFASSNAGAPKFSFGNLGAVQNTPASTSSAPVASFGTPSFSFSFGSQNTTSTTPAFKPAEAEVPKLDNKEFNFVFKGKSPGKQAPVPHNDGIEDVSDDENVEEEENTAYFAPVIPLPDKIEVKTGEEDEEVLYSHRAKLYRFRDREWRERGLGDVKILKHKQTGQLRVVMRREQIHKICLNHMLTPEIEYKLKDSKSWQFTALDYSEGALEPDHFSLRFKTDDIAREFKTAVDAALAGKSVTLNGDVSDQTDNISGATEEERKNIVNFKLPGNFYDSSGYTKCTGCRGCNPDEFIFSEVKGTNHLQVDDNPLPLIQPPKVETTHNDLSKDSKKSGQNTTFSFASFGSENKGNGFSFGSNANANTTPSSGMFFGNSNFKSPFTATADQEGAKNSSSVFGQSNLFGGNVTKTPSAEPVKTTTSFSFNTSSVFGGNTTEEKSPFSFASVTATSQPQEKPADSKPLFGSAPTFGAANILKSPTTNIFGGNTNGSQDAKPKESTPFSFKLPEATTLTPVTATDSPSTQAPVQTSTPINEVNKAADQKTTPSLFGGSAGISFADLAKSTPTNNTSEAFPTANNVSFATLAQNNSNGKPAFASNSTSGGFFGLSNRDTFSNLMQPSNAVNGTAQNATTNNDENETHADDANYDPHYEPIIALPDEIEVSTGEENEEKLFGERAKLYRFDADNKEWKERGVGEFKILYHPANDTYRLLLRREQIHKLVLNMALTADSQINPMKQSDKALVWVGLNYAEEQTNGELESLSVRFKNAELASKFHRTVQNCIDKLKSR